MTDNDNTGIPPLPEKIKTGIRGFLTRTTTIGQSLPPYILIAVLFLIQRGTESANEKEEAKQAAVVNFNDCVQTTRSRISNQENWYDLFEVIRTLGPDAVGLADRLQEGFDGRFDKNIVRSPSGCLELPEFKGKFTLEDIPPER